MGLFIALPARPAMLLRTVVAIAMLPVQKVSHILLWSEILKDDLVQDPRILNLGMKKPDISLQL